MTHVDQQTAATLAYEVKVYTPAELALLQWETVGSVQALSCQRMIFESSSEADAIDQLKFEAFSRHADGLLMRGCEKEGLDLVLNCWIGDVLSDARALSARPNRNDENAQCCWSCSRQF